MSPQATERDLALRAAQGDAEAFGELVRRHQSAVFNVAYRMLGNRRDAEDAAQEAFLRAFRAFGGFDPARPLRPWLKQIAANYCLNWLETARARPAVPETDLAPEVGGLDRWQQPGPTPEQAAVARELSAQLRAAIRRLPPRYRAVIELRHFQELSYEEVATALARPLSDVKSDLFRARKALATLLEQEK